MLGFKEVDVSELKNMLNDGSDTVDLIDVRQPGEVARGAIPGARNIPLHSLPEVMGQLSAEKRTIIYCQTGGRSSQACAFLAAQGMAEVSNLRGGIVAWLQAGGQAV